MQDQYRLTQVKVCAENVIIHVLLVIVLVQLVISVLLVIPLCFDKMMEVEVANVWPVISMLKLNFAPLVGIMFQVAFNALPTQYVRNVTQICNSQPTTHVCAHRFKPPQETEHVQELLDVSFTLTTLFEAQSAFSAISLKTLFFSTTHATVLLDIHCKVLVENGSACL